MTRRSLLDMDPAEFRAIGHDLVDRIADFYTDLPHRKVTPGETPAEVRAILGRAALPEYAEANSAIVDNAWRLLEKHSLHNGHPLFAGYVTSSAAPIGALADLIAAAINPNVGAWILGPIGTEIEAQSIKWIADFLGYPTDCGGKLHRLPSRPHTLLPRHARRGRPSREPRRLYLPRNPHLGAESRRSFRPRYQCPALDCH